VANTLAYYDTAPITAIKRFIVLPPAVLSNCGIGLEIFFLDILQKETVQE
jgi:hypothetical protein